MADTLETKIRKIKVRIKADDPTALDAAIALTEQYPDEPDTWNLLAFASVMNGDYQAAVAATTREISFRPRDPGLFFIRGGDKLKLGDYESAIEDFTEGLRLCDEVNGEPYRSVLHFLRAEAFVQLGRKAEARADLEHVSEDCTFWTIQVRTKADLVALAAE